MATSACILILETQVNSGSCNLSLGENSISLLTIKKFLFNKILLVAFSPKDTKLINGQKKGTWF